MSNVQSIDLSEDRLLAMAADYIDEHNLIGALRMLNKNAAVNGNTDESYMMYAEVFDDMGLYEKCVNGWFKYIDYVGGLTDNADFSDAYEGLAISFMNMGQENFAAYYYNKLLMETAQDLSPESRRQIVEEFITKEKSPLRFAYPPQIADFSNEMERGIGFMRDSDYDRAVAEFEKVDEGNKGYCTARNYIAMCNIIRDKCDEAEAECLSLLRKYPDDVQALTTLAAVKNQQQKIAESKEIAQRLLSLDVDNTDEVYKIATVCCENGMHEQAYKLFCKLETEIGYDCNVLYFKAVSAYNSGRMQESMRAFDKLLTIYPDAVAAQYYYDYVREHRDSQDYRDCPLTYFYRLPKEQRESNLSLLSAFVRLGKGAVKELSRELDITDCIRWCFDEGEGGNSYDLQLLGALCAVRAGYCDDLLRDILLDADLSDALKMQIIAAIAERNEGATYGVVVCNIYKRLTIPPVDVGKNKRKAFIRAYAVLISRFALLNTDYAVFINSAAEMLYARLEEEGRLDDAKDGAALAAAIYHLSGIREGGLDEDTVCAFFGAKQQNYDKILGKKQ